MEPRAELPEPIPVRSSPQRRRRWGHRVLLLLCLGLFSWTLYQQRDTLARVAAHNWDWRRFALAVGCVLTCELLAAVRWWILVRAVTPLRWSAAWRLSLTGLVFNAIMPGANGGDLVKAGVVLASGGPRTLILSSLVLDRLLGLLGLLLLASLAAALAWPAASVGLRPLLLGVWVACGVGVLGLLILFHPLTARLVLRLGRNSPLGPVLERLATAGAAYRAAWPRVVAAVGVAVAANLLSIVGFAQVGAMLFPSFGVGLRAYLLVVPLVFMATALPLPSGAIGVTEQISQQLFALAGHPGGALTMMGFRVACLGAQSIAGLGYVAQRQQLQSLLHPVSDSPGS